MAEAAAVVGLVASIASLVDLSTKVISRLREYSSKSVDVPDSFKSLSLRLPLLTATLQCIQSQAEANHLPSNVTVALKDVVDNSLEQVSIVHGHLRKILPSEDASKFERVFKAVKSLHEGERVQQAVEKIHKNVDFLVLHQTTRHTDIGDRILETLSKMTVTMPTPLTEPANLFSFGTCVGNAPTIALDAFIGRKAELKQLRDWLSPMSSTTRRHIVSIVGMGGMGKTQLSLAHVRGCGSDYTSVFWLNARDQTSLSQSMAELSSIIFPTSTRTTVIDANEENQRVEKVRTWLSAPGNGQWLLIYDNYDDPNLPGARSSTGYDIRPFFPIRSQGSILITSRSTKLAFSTQLRLQKIEDADTSVAILAHRCGRDVSADDGAIALVQRLGGLPLALATAGGFLRSMGMSCTEYLALYESAWIDLMGPDNEEIPEYEARTLSSTWTVTLDHISRQNADAAKLLAFFAYFGSNDIWYELVQGGASDDVPWLHRVTQSKIHFQRTISKLVDYSLVDVVAGSYQLHPCLHDWLVESLNSPPDSQLFIAALLCVGKEIDLGQSAQHWSSSRRLFEHIEQLESPRFDTLWNTHVLDKRVIMVAQRIGDFEDDRDLYDRAERMFQQANAGRERTLGIDHLTTISAVNNLGLLYQKQDKQDQAEEMFQRARAARERLLGPKHLTTVTAVRNLAILYLRQGKLNEAEEMFQQALAVRETELGPEHMSTLEIVGNLGLVFMEQGKPDQAEETFQRALLGKERMLGSEHPSTLDTVLNLGVLYHRQRKLHRAEQMYQRALAGSEKVSGPEHTATLEAVYNLGILYWLRDKPDEAESMYQRTLVGREAVFGLKHPSTLKTIYRLASFYRDQGKSDQAEQLLRRAEAG